MKTIIAVLFLIGAFAFTCNDLEIPENTTDPVVTVDSTQVTDDEAEYELIWEDDFNTDGPVDTTKWIYTGRGDAQNHAYYYKPNDTSLVYCQDGLLNIKFVKDTTDERGYKAGSIRTDGKFSFTYGKVEVKAFFNHGNGSWPGIWMMPQYSYYGGWPASGEIDIMEHIMDLDLVVQTVHTNGTNSGTYPVGHAGSSFNPGEWNVYGIEWSEDKIDFFVNEELRLTYTNKGIGSVQWPFDQPFFMILNVAGGKGMAGAIDETALPFYMQVDYVKIYQKPDQQ